MAELREIAAAECTARLRDWMELAPDAQETLRKAAAGELRFPDAGDRVEPELLRSAVKSAIEVPCSRDHEHEHTLGRRGCRASLRTRPDGKSRTPQLRRKS